MLNARALAVSTLAILATLMPPITHAEELRHYSWGQWVGGSYPNKQTGQFAYCAGGVPYRSGIYMIVSVNRAFGWSLGFADASWNLAEGQEIPVAITFDGGLPWNGTAIGRNKTLAEITMDPNSALINSFRASVRMTVYAAGHVFVFSLDGTSRLMPGLAQCVQTELAIERGEKPPTFASNPPTAQPAPQRPLASQPQGNAELELAATRIASNLLLQAQLPHARLLSRAETPETIRRLGVAWKSDTGVGAVELLAPSAAKDPQQVASQLITSDAAACKGDFASGRSSELIDDTVVTKAFTGCKSSNGSNMFRYFVLMNPGSGYVVYALASPDGASASSATEPSTSPLSDARFEPAAIKAAFAP